MDTILRIQYYGYNIRIKIYGFKYLIQCMIVIHIILRVKSLWIRLIQLKRQNRKEKGDC